MSVRRRAAAAVAALGAALALTVAVPAGPAASATGTGALAAPPVHVTAAQLARALDCSGPLTGLRRDPVLLTPAFSTGAESYGWNYRRQLPADGITTCMLSLPDHGFGDLQAAAEYDVAAVRSIAAASGRKVALLGHQHGALDALWALQFWPDVRTKVSDFVSLATPYHGTTSAAGLCHGLRRCPPSVWQISTGSRFLAALARRALPPGPAYTSVATAYDELIVPAPATSRLAGATNVVVQDVCPGRPIEHFTILADRVTYRIVRDALDHRGAARTARLPASVCSGPLYLPAATTAPGAVAALRGLVGFTSGFGINALLRSAPAEPAVRAYAA